MAREGGLKRSLTSAQLTMIGLGGALGTGLFMGSSIAIAYAGPGVLVSYAIACFITLAVMYSLSEMAVAHPTAGSFGAYADLYVSPWIGFVARYTYWAAQVIAIGGEAIAIGQYLTFWFPALPVWSSALVAGGAIFYVNSRSVASFGTAEYWFSMVKVIAVMAFVLFGLATIFGVGTTATGFSNYRADGGPFPHGFSGVWMAVIMAILSFTGLEVIAVTAGEAKNPDESVPRAMRSMLVRMSLFYFLSLSVILAITPWSQSSATIVTQSPFVKVFAQFGLSSAATIMNFVIISAAFSSMNTNLYLCTRMLFSLSRSNDAPAVLGRVSSRGTPFAAVLLSTAGVLAAAMTAYVSPKAWNLLFGVALFGAILTWIIILFTHIQFRRKYPAEKRAALSVHAPFFPWLQYAGLALLLAVLVTMALDTEFWNVSIIVGGPWIILISICYYFLRRRRARRAGRPQVVVVTPDGN
ncbi:MAG: amino acid permease [Gammaproteobacteria bacterium]